MANSPGNSDEIFLSFRGFWMMCSHLLALPSLITMELLSLSKIFEPIADGGKTDYSTVQLRGFCWGNFLPRRQSSTDSVLLLVVET